MTAEAFREHIDDWVRTALRTDVREFGQLLKALPGVSPLEAAASIERLADEVPDSFSSLPPPIDPVFGPYSSRVPHPIDYDWRYTPEATRKLRSELRFLCGPSPKVALFGCPTLFRELASDSRSGKCWLFDRNPLEIAETRNAEVLVGDVFSQHFPVISTAAAVVDPPWYPEHQLGFLWAASATVRLGGVVLASGPPVGSRPSAGADAAKVARIARTFGLEVDRIQRAALPYYTPPFEAISLRAAGAPEYPIDWRRGDLTVFRKVEPCVGSRPAIATDGAWVEHELRGVRLKVRSKAFSEFDPTLIGLTPGDILPTVSRRDPLRTRVAVWTSGNRVFGTGSPTLVSAALEEMSLQVEAGELAEQVVGRSLAASELGQLKRLRDQLDAIVECERFEYVLRGGDRGSERLAGAAKRRAGIRTLKRGA